MAKKPVVRTLHVLPLIHSKQAIIALQALSRGEADPGQQKLALNYIVNDICAHGAPAYFPGEDGRRNTDIMVGMQLVAHEIVKRLRANLSALQGESNA